MTIKFDVQTNVACFGGQQPPLAVEKQSSMVSVHMNHFESEAVLTGFLPGDKGSHTLTPNTVELIIR